MGKEMRAMMPKVLALLAWFEGRGETPGTAVAVMSIALGIIATERGAEGLALIHELINSTAKEAADANGERDRPRTGDNRGD